jgi:hypothetical protein
VKSGEFQSSRHFLMRAERAIFENAHEGHAAPRHARAKNGDYLNGTTLVAQGPVQTRSNSSAATLVTSGQPDRAAVRNNMHRGQA